MKDRMLVKMLLNYGGMFKPQKNRKTWQLQPSGSGFKVKDTIKELWTKAAEDRHVSGVSLNRGLVERPLREVMKLKSALPWRI